MFMMRYTYDFDFVIQFYGYRRRLFAGYRSSFEERTYNLYLVVVVVAVFVCTDKWKLYDETAWMEKCVVFYLCEWQIDLKDS